MAEAVTRASVVTVTTDPRPPMTLDLLLIALGIALEPLPISGYILLLATDDGLRKGAGFLLGWLLTLVGVIALTVSFTGGKPLLPRSAPSTGALVVRILLGVLLIVFAWRKRRQQGGPPAEPKWMAKLDSLSFPAAMGLGFLLQPWTLVAAGAATVTQANLSSAVTVVVLVVFCVLATSSYLVMQGYALRSPDEARARLDGLNRWIMVHRDQAVVVLSVVVGLWLIAASSYHLAA